MCELSKVLVPIDFSEASEKILHYGAAVAKQFKATLLIVHVVESFEKYSAISSMPHISFGELEKDLRKGAERHMERFLDKTLGEEPEVAFQSMIMAGKITEVINSVAKSEGADLIVMGTHGYKGLERMLFGSVAEGVVKTAPCPVLSINPNQV